MSLQNLQLEFADAICSGHLQMESVLPVQNLRIYQNNVFSHLMQALQNTYPLIEKLVGADFFRICAKEYIKQYPSRSGNLNEYGEYFSDFLIKYEAVKELVYLSEVANFEWTCHVLLTTAPANLLNINLLKNLTPDQYAQINFTLHPASKIIKFYYPILRIIDLCQNDIDGNIDLGENGVNLLIIRRDLDITLIQLPLSDFTLLSSLADNMSLAAALDATLLVDPSFTLDNKLAQWVQERIITDCSLN